ncbi:MAG: hypothetical protein ACYTHJ_11345 [Planctomycetota bacterium]|jgi:hypothetical protein
MGILRAVPLFAILLIIYNLVAFLAGEAFSMAATAVTLTLPSDAVFTMSWNDIFLALGVIVLYIEVLKATRTGSISILDHGLSMVVFVVFLVEFIVVGRCGTATFFILVLMSLLDVLAGFTISIVAARRDLAVAHADVG